MEKFKKLYLEFIINQINHLIEVLNMHFNAEVVDEGDPDWCLSYIRYSEATDRVVFYCREVEVEE